MVVNLRKLSPHEAEQLGLGLDDGDVSPDCPVRKGEHFWVRFHDRWDDGYEHCTFCPAQRKS